VHEVSLVESIVDIVEDAHRQQAFSRVRTIWLQVGALGHAEPDALHFCFDAVTSGTIAEGAVLIIEISPGEGRCPACRHVVAITDRFSGCPVCASPDVRMIAGDELRVMEMEVE
jgi:hydrogenase nickel incorporation protein HypA/HybF